MSEKLPVQPNKSDNPKATLIVLTFIYPKGDTLQIISIICGTRRKMPCIYRRQST